jgi:hypothetical protein
LKIELWLQMRAKVQFQTKNSRYFVTKTRNTLQCFG